MEKLKSDIEKLRQQMDKKSAEIVDLQFQVKQGEVKKLKDNIEKLGQQMDEKSAEIVELRQKMEV